MKKVVMVAGVLACTAVLAMAQSVPNNVFELDGNSVVNGTACTAPNNPVGCRDDFDPLNTGSPDGSIAHSFVTEPAGGQVFTGGGSKDPLPLSGWKWKTGATPDKDFITNGYAAAYDDPSNGHRILIFGADRFAVNGDANIGLWFFKGNVKPLPGGTFGPDPHQDGDLFIVSAFTQGGGTSTITAYLWDHTCTAGVKNPAVGDCADNNLRLRFASVPSATCENVAAGCAIVNPAPITVAWSYASKFGGSGSQVPTGGYYEGGLDLTSVIPSGLSCFNNFLIETRSAQSTSAVLKDFVGGSFPLCGGIAITKACSTSTPPALQPDGVHVVYNWSGTLTNTGQTNLFDVTVTDTLPDGTIQTINVGNIANGGSATFTAGPYTSTNITETNNASVAAALVSGGPKTVTAGVASGTCSVNPTSEIEVTKFCGVPAGPNNIPPALQGTVLETGNGNVHVRVNFSGQVCNNGQTLLSGINLSDDPAATITATYPGTPGTLAPTECATYSGTYQPSAISSGDGTTAGRYLFADTISVSGAKSALGSDPPAVAGCSGAQACAAKSCAICVDSPTGLCSVPATGQ
ncbi:MAG: hypothetical protein LLG20_02945 [Acidobacteriales bacterium]|nr:hypothetical protein [Terriglobales bacterium]